MNNKVVIVGGGIGGTAVGALLAKKGFRVLLLEKNSLIGGRCTTYEKSGFKLDVGCHLFGEGPKGPLEDVCRLVEAPGIIEWGLARDPRPLMHFGGKDIVYSREGIAKTASKTDPSSTGKLFSAMLGMTHEQTKELDYVDLSSWLSKFTGDMNIQAAIGGICGEYFAIPPQIASTGEFIRCFQGVATKKSSAYPLGGCIAIPQAYVSVIEKNGGEVRTSAKVSKIVVDGGKVKGVQLEDGAYIESDIVISNADIKFTVSNLVGPVYFPEEYVERVEKLTYAMCGVVMHVAVDKKITDQKFILYAPGKNTFEDYASSLMKGEVPKSLSGMITSPTNFNPALAPEGKQLIIFGTMALPFGSRKDWEESCLNSLNGMFPELSKHTMWYDFEFVDDIDKFVGEEGNAIGIAQTVDQISDRRPQQATPINGLYIVGAEAGGHGIGTELAANSAIELAEIIGARN